METETWLGQQSTPKSGKSLNHLLLCKTPENFIKRLLLKRN